MSRSTRQVALLRGINLGSRRRVAMPALRELLEDLGFEDVATHLQSGNAVLTSSRAPAATARAIGDGIAKTLDLDVDVVVRTAAELEAVVEGDPLRQVASDPAKHFVVFLDRAPKRAAAKRSGELDFTPERFHLGAREVYMWCPEGMRDSKLAKVDWDDRLGVSTATARNWNTVTRLLEMARG